MIDMLEDGFGHASVDAINWNNYRKRFSTDAFKFKMMMDDFAGSFLRNFTFSYKM